MNSFTFDITSVGFEGFFFLPGPPRYFVCSIRSDTAEPPANCGGHLVIPAYQSLLATSAFLPLHLGELYPSYSHLPPIKRRWCHTWRSRTRRTLRRLPSEHRTWWLQNQVRIAGNPSTRHKPMKPNLFPRTLPWTRIRESWTR